MTKKSTTITKMCFGISQPTTKNINFADMSKLKTQVIFAGRDVTRFYGSTDLFGKGEENPKLGKNKRISYVLYLSPAKFGKVQSPSGGLINTCPNASPECIATCLNEAGNPVYFEAKFKSRIDKTALYFYDKPFFIEKLAKEIIRAAKKHKKDEVAIRVNGTSDLPIIDDLIQMGYMELIPKNVIFYDYTKDPLRAGFWKLKTGHTYVVTFSRSETNTPTAINMLKAGKLVAVVFRKKLPKKWYGFDVINGDMADDIMVDIAEGEYIEIDPKTKKKTGNVYRRKKDGYILGLAAKGKLAKFISKKGAKGFVIDCDNYDDCRVGL